MTHNGEKKLNTINLGICGHFFGAFVRLRDRPEAGIGRIIGPGRVLPSGEEQVRCQFPDGHLDDCPVESLDLVVDGWPAMCHLSRWLVGALKGDAGSCAPPWFYKEGFGDRCWVLYGMGETYWFYSDPGRVGHSREYHLPGVTGETSPEAALVAACELIGLAVPVPSPDPQPESLEPKPPWKDDPPEPPPLTPDGCRQLRAGGPGGEG